MFYIHLKYSVLPFMLIGFWPIEMKNRSLSKVLSGFLNGLFIFIMVTITASLLLEIPHAYHTDLNMMVSNITLGSQFVLIIIRCWTFRLPTMKHLIQQMLVTENNILKGENEEIKVMMMEHVRLIYKICKLYLWASFWTAAIFSCTPFVIKYFNPESELELPLNSWLPFDKNEYYGITYIWNVLGGGFTLVYIIASNLTYFILMIFSTDQLEILKYEIRIGIDNTKYNHEEVHQNLRKIINYYKNIRKFVADLNSIMKYVLLLDFVFHIVHISMVGFSIITTELSVVLLKNVWYFLATVFGEVTAFYWLGNEICVQNCGVTDAIWESDWYNCNPSNKKTILILMMQSQQALKIDVGYSRILSWETFLMVLKTSASYMITLKQFIAMKTHEA